MNKLLLIFVLAVASSNTTSSLCMDNNKTSINNGNTDELSEIFETIKKEVKPCVNCVRLSALLLPALKKIGNLEQNQKQCETCESLEQVIKEARTEEEVKLFVKSLEQGFIKHWREIKSKKINDKQTEDIDGSDESE